jgi:hypothetical protein
MPRIPALRTRVNAVKRELHSQDPTRILAGARALADHDPEVADALLEGVRVEQTTTGADRLVPNRTFEGKRAEQASLNTGLWLAVAHAPEGSRAAALRDGIFDLTATTAAALPVDVLTARMPALRSIAVAADATGLQGLAGSRVTRLELATDPRTPADLRPLADLSLAWLRVRGRGTVDGLDVLETLAALEDLELWGTRGLRLDRLPRGLRTLRVHDATDTRGLSGLPPRLETLALSGCSETLAPLGGLPLSTLALWDPPGLGPLAGHPTLKSLSIARGAQDDLEGLSGLLLLEELVLTRQDALTRLDGLRECPSLRRLHVAGRLLGDIAALAPLTHLEDLELRDAAALTDLSILQGLPGLRRLVVHRCGAHLPSPPSDPFERARSPLAHVRSQAMGVLADVPGERSLQVVREALADPLTSRAAARALAERPDGHEALALAVQNGSTEALWAAVERRVDVDLEACLADPARREEAAAAAVGIPGDADVLQPLLDDADPEVRRWAVLAWAARSGAPDALVGHLADADARVRRAAVCGLGRSGASMEAVPSDLAALASAWARRWPAPDAGWTPPEHQLVLSHASDLDDLAGSASRALSLRRLRVHDLSVLQTIDGLERLDLERIPARDFTVLGAIGTLRSLVLRGTELVDPSPLVRLSGLVRLDLRDTPFDAPDVLVHLPLERVELPSRLRWTDPVGRRLVHALARGRRHAGTRPVAEARPNA